MVMISMIIPTVYVLSLSFYGETSRKLAFQLSTMLKRKFNVRNTKNGSNNLKCIMPRLHMQV